MDTNDGKKLNLDWTAVEKSLAEGTFSGYKMGVVETEKLFNQALRDKKIPGRGTEGKIKYIRRFFSAPEKLENARLIYQKIINESHFEIDRENTKQAVNAYWQAILDIDEAIHYLNFWEKWKLRFGYFIGLWLKKIEKIAFGALLLLLLFLFFGETALGQNIFSAIVLFADWLILKILIWPAGAYLAFIIIQAIFRFFKKRKTAKAAK